MSYMIVHIAYNTLLRGDHGRNEEEGALLHPAEDARLGKNNNQTNRTTSKEQTSSSTHKHINQININRNKQRRNPAEDGRKRPPERELGDQHGPGGERHHYSNVDTTSNDNNSIIIIIVILIIIISIVCVCACVCIYIYMYIDRCSGTYSSVVRVSAP